MDQQKNKNEISMNAVPLEEEEAKEGFCQIDRKMVRFKIHFFLFYGSMGAILPYEPLIAKDRIGISATSLATVLIALTFSTLFTRTILGYIADYFKRMKMMMSVLMILHCLLLLSHLIIPPVKHFKRNAQNSTLSDYIESYENETELRVISMSRNTDCDVPDDVSTDFKSQLEVRTKELRNQQGILCLIPNNVSTVFICFQQGNNTNDVKMALQTSMSFCCSTYTSKFEKYSTPLNAAGNHFHFAYFDLGMINNNFNKSFHCTVEFSDRLTRSSSPESSVSDFQTYQFWLYAVLMILAGNCNSSVFTLSDTICCDTVQKHKRDFGRQRIYSGISWGLFAPLGGLLRDLTNGFYATWILMAFMQCMTLWNLYKMDIVIPQFSQNLAKDVGKVLKSSTFLAFNVGVLLHGINTAIIWYYLLWFTSSLGASAFLCGLIPYMQCFVGELPVVFYSGFIIKKIGHFNSLSLCLLFYAVRFLLYSYLENPWLVLPIEIAHGVTNGLFYPTVASFGKLNAKIGTEATTQSILFSTHEGLGSGIGCILSGIGFDTFGSHWTFFYFSIFAFGSTLLNICSTLLFGKGYSETDDESLSTE